ncbi:MAG: membrane dipeptidase [Lachnospiraceae bacterium]|jgi:membrane dipeptidase|nr:membrane dipeptidase [Lachnospiraceae bacterium]
MKVVDMHCDTISELYERRIKGEKGDILSNRLHIDLEKMEKGDYLLQNFALFTHLKREEDPFAYAMRLVDVFYQEMEAHPDRIRVAKTWQDIEENNRQGRMSALLTIEEGGVCLGDLSLLRNFYRLGVRMMTLTWNFPNELAYPNQIISGNDRPPVCVADTEHGLTDTGIEFVREMERLGMIVDISHLGDRGIWDVFQYTKKPFVASHSNARALAGHPRNLTDEMIRALGERGGVAGINFCAAFLKDKENDSEMVHSYCSDMVSHMKHMRQIGGIGCMGLGSDFDGITSILDMGDCSGIQLLAQEMECQGFTVDEMEAVFSKNVLRVYRELL